jgi:hypothetical protein
VNILDLPDWVGVALPFIYHLYIHVPVPVVAVIVLTSGEAQLDSGFPVNEACGLGNTVTQLLPLNPVSVWHPHEFVTTIAGQ